MKHPNSIIPRFDISRRSFLKTCSAAALAAGVPTWFVERELSAAAARPALGPNDRPGIALVGCGGQGRGDAGNARRFGDIVAVCDVDEKHAEQAAARVAWRYLREIADPRHDGHAVTTGAEASRPEEDDAGVA